MDVNQDNRTSIVETFGHEIAHGQGIKNETSADLIGKTVDWAFDSGIQHNQSTINQYKNQLGDGKDETTQAQNQDILKKDNQTFIDNVADHPDEIDDKTSYKQSIANSLFCWNKECTEKFNKLDKAQEEAYRKGQNQAISKFVEDIKNIPNVPKEVYEAVKNDPKGTAIAILKGLSEIPGDIWDTTKIITKVNAVGDTPAEFEKLGNAEMTAALNVLSGAFSAGIVTVSVKAGKIIVVAGKNLKNTYILARTPEGISFKINQPAHLSKVESYTQKNGITGGHNSISFYESTKKNNIKILSEKDTGVKGIKNIEYQIPALDRTGKVIGYKNEIKTKTVYDPKIITDSQILELGQKAAIKGYKDAMNSKSGQANATINGINFRIYVDKNTGEVRNFHPN